MTNPELPIHGLEERHHGLTRAIADSHTEAFRVCFDRHHEPPVSLTIREAEQRLEAVVGWETTDERTRGAWANEIDTTEAGAYACALAATELMYGMVAVRRAETETGADYYIATPGTPMDDLENCIRLEVSGVDRGNAATVRRRLREKLDQAAEGNSNLPAIAGIVGFRECLVLLERLEES